MDARMALATSPPIPGLKEIEMGVALDGTKLERMSKTAGHQFGVISVEQLRGIGFDRRAVAHLCTSGRIRLVRPGVYAIQGAPPSVHRDIMEAVLGTHDAVASHNTALWLLGLTRRIPNPIELQSPHELIRSIPGVVVHRTRAIDACDITTIEGIPTTNATRTLIDMASQLDRLRLEQLVDSMLMRGMTTPERASMRLNDLGRSGRKGAGNLHEILELRMGAGVLDSAIERRFMARLREAGLPEPLPQYDVSDGTGGWIARVDFAFVSERLVIEIDGQHHREAHVYRADSRRQNLLIADGWRVFRWTATDIDRHFHRVAATLRAELSRGG